MPLANAVEDISQPFLRIEGIAWKVR